MGTTARFVQTAYTVPPGGAWFFQIGDDRVAHPVYEIALKRVDELLKKHGDKRPAAQALAEFMCPHMPARYCAGAVKHSPVIHPTDAAKAVRPFFSRALIPVDIVTRRLEICQDCRKHRRDFCLHCTGYDEWVRAGFDHKRPPLPADEASGCCECTGTFEMAMASVEYDKDEPVWEGAPETCWRRLEK